MTNLLNIASNEETIFFSISKKDLNKEIIEKVNAILNEEYIRSTLIPYISDVEQAELERILDSMSEEDTEIVSTEVFQVNI